MLPIVKLDSNGEAFGNTQAEPFRKCMSQMGGAGKQ